jgi:aerobic carbon-monoxide dehydrogenase small subunit
MRTIRLTVNGRPVVEAIDERMHLADFLREKLTLTATHLRCEQGVCGACTLLIDGQTARSCITYAALCEGAEVTTLEGLEHDPVVVALRHAFMMEHGLQCGFCTPAMLVTARDIVTRVPDAEDARIRLELSGNLCRCTGYAGIVRAIRRVLDERKAGTLKATVPVRERLGPVGTRAPVPSASSGNSTTRPTADETSSAQAANSGALGLGSTLPNITLRQSFTVARSPHEVWRILSDIARVVPCMPGASLTGSIEGDRAPGRMTVKLGPITATFNGEALITRDDARHRGSISGGGRDRFTRSRVTAELAYAVSPRQVGAGTQVDIDVRAILTGPLAQFGRSGIVEEMAARLTQLFAANLERQMAGADATPTRTADDTAALTAGALLGGALMARLRVWINRLFGKPSA